MSLTHQFSNHSLHRSNVFPLLPLAKHVSFPTCRRGHISEGVPAAPNSCLLAVNDLRTHAGISVGLSYFRVQWHHYIGNGNTKGSVAS